MKIISSYGVELRKQNIPIRQTLEIYRSAVRYLVITLALAFVVLHEPFTAKSLIGCALITAGTLFMVL